MKYRTNVPTVSIGLPVFNGANYIRLAIESILSQTFEDFELIISDNGSIDDTRAICEQYVRLDPRIRYHSFAVNQGAARNYNNVFNLSRGKYFKWAAHDDECHPEFLSRCVEVFEEGPSAIVVVYTKEHFIDAEGTIIREVSSEFSLATRHRSADRRLAHVLKVVGTAGAVFGLIKADALRKSRLIDTFIGSDLVLVAELAMLGEIVEVPQLLFRRRIHPGISTKASRNNDDLLGWLDPAGKRYKSLVAPLLLLPRELVRSVYCLPISRSEKWRCYALIHTLWYFRVLRNYVGRLRNRGMINSP